MNPAIKIAQKEYAKVATWILEYPGICIYCGEDADSIDHLVPRAISGKTDRKYVPVVPACLNCNIIINDSPIFTIKGRAAIVAYSIRKTHKKELKIPFHNQQWFADFSPRMRANLEKRQMERQLLKQRLKCLDRGGMVYMLTESSADDDPLDSPLPALTLRFTIQGRESYPQ